MRSLNLAVLALILLFVGVGPSVFAQDAKLGALLTAVKANPKDADAHFNLGVEYFNRKDFSKAIQELEKAVKIDSKDKEAKEFLESARGIQAYLDRDYEKAEKYFRTTLKINPRNPNANQLLPNCYLHLKQYDKAEKAYQEYLAAFPGDKEAARVANQNLSNLYIDQKRYTEAIATLKKQLAVDPTNFDANNNLGVAYYYMKDYPKAIAAWEKALKYKKSDQTYKFLGFSYYNLGKFADATSKYEAGLKLNPNDPELYYNLAVAYFDNAEYDKAAAAFGSAFRLDPEDSLAATGQAQAIEAAIANRMEKGSSLYLNNEYTEAIQEWKGVLKYQADHKEAKAFIADAESKMKGEVGRHIKAGKSYEQQGRNIEALRELNLALAMDPGNEAAKTIINRLKVKRSEKVGSYLEQGDSYFEAKDYAAAVLKYQAALRVNPEDPKAKSRLAKTKELQKSEYAAAIARAKKASDAGQYKKAIQAYEAARRINPQSKDAGDLLFRARAQMRSRIKDLLAEGESLFAAGQKDKAREKFLAVAALDQENSTANDYIQRLTGKESQAKVDSEKVKALYYEGVNLYINGKIHDAIARWKDCLKLDPGYANAQKNIDKAYVKLQSIQKLGAN